MDFLNIKFETETEFEQIADQLLNHYAIQNHEALYRLIEIEFYWTSATHIDHSTYRRKYVNPRQGTWFFHYAGVDLALRNDELKGYGGILIRKIYSAAERKFYKGPLVCAMKLFSGTSAFEKSLATQIVEYDFPKLEIQKSARIGLGKNAKQSGTENLKYRFFVSLKKSRKQKMV